MVPPSSPSPASRPPPKQENAPSYDPTVSLFLWSNGGPGEGVFLYERGTPWRSHNLSSQGYPAHKKTGPWGLRFLKVLGGCVFL